jgi:predicted Zn-dependent protease
MAEPTIDAGLLVSHSPTADVDRLKRFARHITDTIDGELRQATGATWTFHFTEMTRLHDDDARRPSDFLDEASLQMVEGPFDFVVVVTDVGLVSSRSSIVAGLASPASRVAILSTRKLLLSPRGQPTRTLEDEAVQRNAATLLLHLIGHLLGLHHSPASDGVMAPFTFDEDRALARFCSQARTKLQRAVSHFPEPIQEGGMVQQFAFHLSSAVRHPLRIGKVLWQNRAPFLALSLPRLATAAVTPTFLLVFTAETWDVGVNMTNGSVCIFGVLSVLAATCYLTTVQNLYFPRKEKHRITRHMALLNVVIFLTILMAIVGLFVMVSLLMLFIESYIFPADLITAWPTLDDPVVSFGDKLRLAAFISIVGVLTGALAGGLESRAVIRHLTLFLRSP